MDDWVDTFHCAAFQAMQQSGLSKLAYWITSLVFYICVLGHPD